MHLAPSLTAPCRLVCAVLLLASGAASAADAGARSSGVAVWGWLLAALAVLSLLLRPPGTPGRRASLLPVLVPLRPRARRRRPAARRR